MTITSDSTVSLLVRVAQDEGDVMEACIKSYGEKERGQKKRDGKFSKGMRKTPINPPCGADLMVYLPA